jgi:hypothetical protein
LLAVTLLVSLLLVPTTGTAHAGTETCIELLGWRGCVPIEP